MTVVGLSRIACAVALLSAGGCMGGELTTIGTELATHPATPSSTTLRVNGRALVTSRVGPLKDVGTVPGGGGRLRYEVVWLELHERAGYRASFEIDPARLSTFDAEGTRGQIAITLGPGADLRVTTPDPEWLRAVGERRPADAGGPPSPTVLLETCAARVSSGDPALAGLFIPEGDGARYWPDEARRSYLAANPMPRSRCAGGG